MKMTLKRNNILGVLSDEMINKIIPYVQKVELGDRKIIYHEGDIADNFYMLDKGKILLEVALADKATVTIGTINAGSSFGIASLLDRRVYKSTAITAENSEILFIPSTDLLDLTKNDDKMASLLMRQISYELYKKLIKRSEQFIRSIITHPDFAQLGSIS